ncbi:unnamed protein product [[Candida] boidinii]|nr:unnamed protein product [[Candida] boidinii]
MNANQPPTASFLASPLQQRRYSSVSNSTSNSSSISLLNQHQIQSNSRNIFKTNNLTSSIEEDSFQSINSIITDNNSTNNIITNNNKNNEQIVNGYSYYPDINDLDKDMSHREQKNNLLRTPRRSTNQNINSRDLDKTRRRDSEITDSSNLLLDSEWVLFSPSHSQYSNVTRGSDNNGYDDVLSSTIDRTATYTTSSQELDEYEEESEEESEEENEENEEYEEDDEVDEEEEDDDEDDDSLIEALQNHMKSDNIINKDDLNSRIDNWRKEQVSLFLDDLTKSGVDNDTLELIKAWGIDDSEECLLILIWVIFMEMIY